MIAVDANVLSLFLYPNSSAPLDFETGKPISHARERVVGLISDLDEQHEVVVIPAPALAEALVLAAPDVDSYMKILNEWSCFRIRPFGQREAIELAIRTRRAIDTGDKREGVAGSWQKIKYDRQIVAIAATEGVQVIYSTDEDVHKHARLWGIQALNISHLPVPDIQGDLELVPETPELSGDDEGGEAGAVTDEAAPSETGAPPES